MAEEPLQIIQVLLADVFQVTGINASEIFVELQVGSLKAPESSVWVLLIFENFKLFLKLKKLNFERQKNLQNVFNTFFSLNFSFFV